MTPNTFTAIMFILISLSLLTLILAMSAQLHPPKLRKDAYEIRWSRVTFGWRTAEGGKRWRVLGISYNRNPPAWHTWTLCLWWMWIAFDFDPPLTLHCWHGKLAYDTREERWMCWQCEMERQGYQPHVDHGAGYGGIHGDSASRILTSEELAKLQEDGRR